MKKLDNIIDLTDNDNQMEIIEYLESYYVDIDYHIEFEWKGDMGVIGEPSKATLHLYTDEIREDGELAYLIAEESIRI